MVSPPAVDQLDRPIEVSKGLGRTAKPHEHLPQVTVRLGVLRIARDCVLVLFQCTVEIASRVRGRPCGTVVREGSWRLGGNFTGSSVGRCVGWYSDDQLQRRMGWKHFARSRGTCE